MSKGNKVVTFLLLTSRYINEHCQLVSNGIRIILKSRHNDVVNCPAWGSDTSATSGVFSESHILSFLLTVRQFQYPGNHLGGDKSTLSTTRCCHRGPVITSSNCIFLPIKHIASWLSKMTPLCIHPGSHHADLTDKSYNSVCT